MDPQTDNTAQPVSPQAPSGGTADMPVPAVTAGGTAPPPSAPPPGNTPGWLPPTVPVKPGGSAPPPDDTPGAVPTPAVPDTADDGDLIEKEWVIKAKHIVDNTRQDPYEQAKQMDKFKAEYMKKRYNKIIGSTGD